MAVDIYNTRRTNYFKCKYWVRDERGFNDDDTLIHEKKPTGIFYAREVDTTTKDTMEIADVWQIDTEKVHLETTDFVEGLEKNALVLFEDNLYIVDYVEEHHIHKKSKFSNRKSIITKMYLRRTGD